MNDQIVEWKLVIPDRWGGWAPGCPAAELDTVAHTLADSEAARERAREGIGTVARSYDAHAGLVVQYAVWVPHRETGQVYAFMQMDVVRGEPGLTAEVFLEQAKHPPKERGVKLLAADAALGRATAGPAVVMTRSFVHKKTKSVWSEVTWNVFAPGTPNIVTFAFGTQIAECTPAMTDESITLVNSLAVTLGTRV